MMTGKCNGSDAINQSGWETRLTMRPPDYMANYELNYNKPTYTSVMNIRP